jgi:hypothetical protein
MIPNCFLILTSLSVAAPAPFPKVSSLPPGDYTLAWKCGLKFDVVLRADGTYRDASSDYNGTWTWDQKRRVLRVSEHPAKWESAPLFRWEATLGEDLSGKAKSLEPDTDSVWECQLIPKVLKVTHAVSSVSP